MAKKNNCAPVLTPAVTVLDSPNIAVINNDTNVTISGSTGYYNQQDVNYLLAANISVTGTLTEGVDRNEVGFGYGWMVPPSSPNAFTQSWNYPAQEQTDFAFYLNGVRLEDRQVLDFQINGLNTQSTASLDVGFDLEPYDVVTAVGRFKIS